MKQRYFYRDTYKLSLIYAMLNVYITLLQTHSQENQL